MEFTNDVRNSIPFIPNAIFADIIFESSSLSVDGGCGDGALLDGGRVADGAVARLAPEADRVLLVREVRHCRKQQRINILSKLNLDTYVREAFAIHFGLNPNTVLLNTRSKCVCSFYLSDRGRLQLSGSCS